MLDRLCPVPGANLQNFMLVLLLVIERESEGGESKIEADPRPGFTSLVTQYCQLHLSLCPSPKMYSLVLRRDENITEGRIGPKQDFAANTAKTIIML